MNCPICQEWFSEPMTLEQCTCSTCGNIQGFAWVIGQDKFTDFKCRECAKKEYGILPILLSEIDILDTEAV